MKKKNKYLEIEDVEFEIMLDDAMEIDKVSEADKGVIGSRLERTKPNPKTSGKPYIRKQFGKRVELTPDELAELASLFAQKCDTEMETVNLDKTNVVTGGALAIDRPVPPLIESFIQFAGISYYTFDKYRNAKKKMKKIPIEEREYYEAICEDIVEYCNTKILEYMTLGWINEGSAKFYLQNNSRYQTVVRHQISVDEVEPPAWLRGVANKELKEPENE